MHTIFGIFQSHFWLDGMAENTIYKVKHFPANFTTFSIEDNIVNKTNKINIRLC